MNTIPQYMLGQFVLATYVEADENNIVPRIEFISPDGEHQSVDVPVHLVDTLSTAKKIGVMCTNTGEFENGKTVWEIATHSIPVH
ncbi:MAG: hypothetical protein R3E13_10725 [Alphaproteobacteria bacterium]